MEGRRSDEGAEPPLPPVMGSSPHPSSSNVLPLGSNDNSPQSANFDPAVNTSQHPSGSMSSQSPTSPIGTQPRQGQSPISQAQSPAQSQPQSYGYGYAYGHRHQDSTSTSVSGRPEGYPSWIARRPPAPEPPSTVGFGNGTRPSTRAGFDSPSPDSLAGDIEWEHLVGPDPGRPSEDMMAPPTPDDSPIAGPSNPAVRAPYVPPRRHTHIGLPSSPPPVKGQVRGERRPTPRSVRIMSVGGPPGSREASDSTRVPSGSLPAEAGYRAYSKATGAGPAHAYGSISRPGSMVPQPQLGQQMAPPQRPPRFRTPKFHPTILRDPSGWTRLRFYLWGFIVVFGHLILQTFLDFNVAYMMLQVAKHPTPSPVGSSESGKNWTFAAVGYIACWVAWVFGVVFLYEALYCFWRRWRAKRPLMIPIYLSSPAYSLACMTGYTNFCFLQHIRWSALGSYNSVALSDSSSDDHRSIRDESWENLERPSLQSDDAAVAPLTDSSVTEEKGHRRKFSAATASSADRIRMSEGVESSAMESEDRPQISELASSPEIHTTALRQPEPAQPPIRPGPKGAEGSAFFEHQHDFTPARRHSRSSSSSSVGSVRKGRDVLQFVAESCWFYSQNLPTIVLLIPRLALTLALYIAFIGPSTGTTLGSSSALGRDATFFGTRSELTGYAQVIVWIQLAWGVWRIGVLIASWLGLWILSGLGCAGLCGPRYRWEEMTVGQELEDDSSPPYGYPSAMRQRIPLASQQGPIIQSGSNRLSTMTVADARFADRLGRRAFSDPDDHTINWSWMERCRDRVWDTFEFCMVKPAYRGKEREGAQDAYWSAWRTATHPSQGMSERPGAGRGILASGAMFVPPTAGEYLPQPVTVSGQGYGALDSGMLATLPEISSNPSRQASSSVLPPHSKPASPRKDEILPLPLPIFSAEQKPKRGVLTQDLFVAPPAPRLSDDAAWLGSSAVPLSGPQTMAAAVPPTYPFPAYSSSGPLPPQRTVSPQATQESTAVEQASQARPSHHPNVFPTPATTVHSLPFPAPLMVPADDPLTEYADNGQSPSSENAPRPHGHARQTSGSGTGSMSSLGQPLQPRYPFGFRRGTARGRHSSASGSGSGALSPRDSQRDSMVSAGSGGYIPRPVARSQNSISTGLSGGSRPEGEPIRYGSSDLGSQYSSPIEPGMAGVGAGGGMGPRHSLINLASSSSPLSSPQYDIAPPPRNPHGGRRRAGTLPSTQTSPVGTVPPPMPSSLEPPSSNRGRVASVPSPPATRDQFAPIPGYELDMSAFSHAHGFYDDEDDEENEGSQEAAEREDSVGLLSQAPSRRSSFSAMNLRVRGSNISLHRWSNSARSVSNASGGQNPASGVRSRAASLVGRGPQSPVGSRENLNDPNADPANRSSTHYSDARSAASKSGESSEVAQDMTFGVQIPINWNLGQHFNPSGSCGALPPGEASTSETAPHASQEAASEGPSAESGRLTRPRSRD